MLADTTFFQSDPVLALAVAVVIFLLTILLVVKRWVGFPGACLLLLLALAAGILFNHRQAFHYYGTSSQTSSLAPVEASIDTLQKQLLLTVEELQREIKVEKENVQQIMKQIQDIFASLDTQKQKLQSFIEETRQKFKKEEPPKEAASTSVAELEEKASSVEASLPSSSHQLSND
jgi:hypothetical protein